MEKRWVEEFFDAGRLRLSSYRRFAAHSDERMRDEEEGQVSVFLQPAVGQQGQTMWAALAVAPTAYILCASMRLDEPTRARFGSNDYIKIVNTVAFGQAVARHVPGYGFGFEGPCVYQHQRILHRSVPGLHDSQSRDQTGAIDLSKFNHLLNHNVRGFQYLLKERRHADELEYRFIWEHDSEGREFIDIVVPEARKFCEAPSEFHNV